MADPTNADEHTILMRNIRRNDAHGLILKFGIDHESRIVRMNKCFISHLLVLKSANHLQVSDRRIWSQKLQTLEEKSVGS